MVGVLWLAWKRLAASRRVGSSPAFTYTTPESLAEVSARFERLLLRSGIACPPQRTWHDHIATLDHEQPEVVPLDLPTIQAFLKAYNDARFGEPGNAVQMERVQTLLHELEKPA